MSRLNKNLTVVLTSLSIAMYVFVAYGVQMAFRMLPVASETQLTNTGLQVDSSTQTKIMPDLQLQKAKSAQSTVGIE